MEICIYIYMWNVNVYGIYIYDVAICGKYMIYIYIYTWVIYGINLYIYIYIMECIWNRICMEYR